MTPTSAPFDLTSYTNFIWPFPASKKYTRLGNIPFIFLLLFFLCHLDLSLLFYPAVPRIKEIHKQGNRSFILVFLILLSYFSCYTICVSYDHSILVSTRQRTKIDLTNETNRTSGRDERTDETNRSNERRRRRRQRQRQRQRQRTDNQRGMSTSRNPFFLVTLLGLFVVVT